MKKFLLILGLISCCTTEAQEKATSSPETYIKANALFLPFGIINTGVEHQISKKITAQADLFISPWKSFDGKYAQIYMINLDGRYYFKEAFKGWYIGAAFSLGYFKIQKWDYWKDQPYQKDENLPVYIASNLYQEGHTFIIGAVGGYQVDIGKNWKMDLFASFGSSQDFYRGYDKISGDRYDDPYLNRRWNRSGEWIPFRGGIMISYKIK